MSQCCIATNTLQDSNKIQNTYQDEYLKTLKYLSL